MTLMARLRSRWAPVAAALALAACGGGDDGADVRSVGSEGSASAPGSEGSASAPGSEGSASAPGSDSVLTPGSEAGGPVPGAQGTPAGQPTGY